MSHICVGELGHHIVQGMACHLFLATSHYLNQCWIIVDWRPGNKFQLISSRNSFILIQEIVFEIVVCKMVAIFSRGRWVNWVNAPHHNEKSRVDNPWDVVHKWILRSRLSSFSTQSSDAFMRQWIKLSLVVSLMIFHWFCKFDGKSVNMWLHVFDYHRSLLTILEFE